MIFRKYAMPCVVAALAFLSAAPCAISVAAETNARPVQAPVVSVVEARVRDIVEVVQVTGTLLPREEVLVGPEIEGFRVLELLVDEGDFVTKGQVLARLSRETILAQLAQSNAQLGRAAATIEQSRSNIELAEAAIAQSEPALTRARALLRTGAGTDASVEQRASEQNANLARLNSARRGLSVSQADKLNIEAQRDELNLRLDRTEVRAPAAGLVSRRSARVGGVASMAAEPMFRIIANGEIELEAEVPDFRIQAVRSDNPAIILPANNLRVAGKVRLVSPEVDKTSRMGKVRISTPPNESLRIGAFARGEIETQRRRAIAVPASAVLYNADGAYVHFVRDGKVAFRKVSVGLIAAGVAEIKAGLSEGDVVVARSGAFLNDGDAIEARNLETADQARPR